MREARSRPEHELDPYSEVTAPSKVVAEEREPDPYREDGGEG